MKNNYKTMFEVKDGYRYHMEELFYEIGELIILLFAPIALFAVWIVDDVKRLITGKGFYEE